MKGRRILSIAVPKKKTQKDSHNIVLVLFVNAVTILSMTMIMMMFLAVVALITSPPAVSSFSIVVPSTTTARLCCRRPTIVVLSYDSKDARSKIVQSCSSGGRRQRQQFEFNQRGIASSSLLLLNAAASDDDGNNKPSSTTTTTTRRTTTTTAATAISEEDLKQQLTEYLAKRKESNADEAAKEVKGKIIGGTRGNAVLEFVSGAPVKEQIIDKVPDIFDYDELSKYGYSHLVTPIMDTVVGGRRAVYTLMDMAPPPLVGPPPKKIVPKIVIDRTGENDAARYTGLKMTQVIDDNMMAEALIRANTKSQEQKEMGTNDTSSLRPTLMEEDYVQPFADKRNTGPAQVPDWTAEKLDEYARQQGKAQSWARRSRMGEYVKDPSETADLSFAERSYALSTAFFIAFALGRSTSNFLVDVLHIIETTAGAQTLQDALRIPALLVALASVGSCLFCGAVMAPARNRSSLSWGIKGLLGGPLTVLQLQKLDSLITREEKETAGYKIAKDL